MILKQTNTVLDISNIDAIELIALRNDIQREIAYRDTVPPMTDEMYQHLREEIHAKWQYGKHEEFDVAYIKVVKEVQA